MKSIRNSTTLFTVASIALILALGLMTIDGVLSAWLEKQFDEALHSKAQALVTLTKSNGVDVEMDFADEFMPEFSRLENPEFFQLYMQSGVLLERSRSYDIRQPAIFVRPAEDVEIKDVGLPNGRSGRQISIRFIPQIEDKFLRSKYPEENREKALIFLSRERKSLDNLLVRFHILIAGTGLLVVVLITFAVMKSIRSGLVPLEKMAKDISRITAEHVNVPIDTENQPVELTPIATQFNLVLTEIEKAMSRERQFSSDVAHELRTPVSEMLALSEVGMRWLDEKEAPAYFSDIHESSRHLDQLISNLLQLSRCDVGDVEIEISEVQLDSLIYRVCSRLKFEAKVKSISFSPIERKLPKLLTDESWLELILFNLLANAIAHSPCGATIEIETISIMDKCSINIKNPMQEGLTEKDFDQIFERFWRKESARTSGKHAGIGLALVKSYADCLKLELETFLSEDQLFCIRLSNIKTIY